MKTGYEGITEKVCPICGKRFCFQSAELWGYKRTASKDRILTFCSYGCLRKWEKGQEQEAETDAAVRIMKHMIGLDHAKPYRHGRGGGSYYRPYRNYYDAGKGEIPELIALCRSGSARKTEDGMYELTVQGLRRLGEKLGVTIWNPCLTNEPAFRKTVERYYLAAGGATVSVKRCAEELQVPEAQTQRVCLRLYAAGKLNKERNGYRAAGKEEAECI